MIETFRLAAIPEEDEALRPLARSLAREAVASLGVPERARSWSGFDAAFSRRLGAAGLLGLTMPRRYGGGERSAFARFVVVEELLAVGAPVAAHWVGDRQSAPLILKFGSEAQRGFFLPRICASEIVFCIGMSEPGSGSDLASVRTRADKTATGWRVNGQKVWTTHAMRADYMIALLRTSGTPEDRHKGLSQLVIDLKTPGITVRPIRDLNGDEHFAEVFFEDVELADDALVGAEGQGWEQVMAELAFERSGPERIYASVVLLDAWLTHLRAVGRDDPARHALVGGMLARMGALRAMSLACTARLAAGESPVAEASLVKDLGTSFEQDVPRLVADDLASHPDEPCDPQLWRALVHTGQIAPSFSLRGGTREILRGIIARGLGLR